MLPSRLLAWREQIDRELADRCVWPTGGCPQPLGEAIRYSLLAPGKRLRPLLVLCAAEACGSLVEAAYPAACSVEMIHAYSLIHDDLPAMDDDTLRRGRPTCHIQFGEATAILAGDALQAMAFATLAGELPAVTAARCCQVLATAAGPCHLVGGQADDMADDIAEPTFTDRPTNSDRAPADSESEPAMAALESIHRRKTGALLAASLQLGGIIAEATDEPLDALRTYGLHIGLAFQIVDDLLDHAGHARELGKLPGRDAELGKRTYPRLLGVEASTARAAHLIDHACASLSVLPGPTDALERIARYILARDR